VVVVAAAPLPLQPTARTVALLLDMAMLQHRLGMLVPHLVMELHLAAMGAPLLATPRRHMVLLHMGVPLLPIPGHLRMLLQDMVVDMEVGIPVADIHHHANKWRM
jgi:hypothetical protein